MIDEIKLQNLIEKMEVFQECAESSYRKFQEVLNMLDEFYTTVNGYPGKAVEILLELQQQLERMEKVMCNFSIPEPSSSSGTVSLTFWHYIFIIVLTTVGGFFGMLFSKLIFG